MPITLTPKSIFIGFFLCLLGFVAGFLVNYTPEPYMSPELRAIQMKLIADQNIRILKEKGYLKDDGTWEIQGNSDGFRH